MAEHFLSLSTADRTELLLAAGSRLGRPAYLLEKDLWVVWTLNELFTSPIGKHLRFKGGTSLSKAYRLIDRFSEDVDLTYDIRQILGTDTEQQLPSSRSEARRWSAQVRARLPDWVGGVVQATLSTSLAREEINATLIQDDDRLYLYYPVLTSANTYVQPRIMLEFGARSCGEPYSCCPISCDIGPAAEGIMFPEATPLVMDVARTFWEKATAAHVYCRQNRLKGERFARHWHDLAAIGASAHLDQILQKFEIANLVADHKSWFFRERTAQGTWVNYHEAVTGQLHIIPEGDARSVLEDDYERMLEGGMFDNQPISFNDLMERCSSLENRLNASAATRG